MIIILLKNQCFNNHNPNNNLNDPSPIPFFYISSNISDKSLLNPQHRSPSNIPNTNHHNP